MSPLLGILSSGGLAPGAPTIGTATDGGTGTSASVAFTAPSWTGKGSGTVTYTATSSPGSLTGTATSSPVTVSGLTTGTAYTFTVKATTSYGVTGASSAASNSVTPASPSSYESIATVTGTGSASSVTFSSIPSTYKHLQIRSLAKDSTTSYSSGILLYVRFNGATTSYTMHNLVGNGSTATSTGSTDNSSIFIDNACSTSGTGMSNIFATSIIDIIDYSSTSKNKTLRALSGVDANDGTTNFGVQLTSGLWLNTAAISSITILADGSGFTNSTFALYGIKGA